MARTSKPRDPSAAGRLQRFEQIRDRLSDGKSHGHIAIARSLGIGNAGAKALLEDLVDRGAARKVVDGMGRHLSSTGIGMLYEEDGEGAASPLLLLPHAMDAQTKLRLRAVLDRPPAGRSRAHAAHRVLAMACLDGFATIPRAVEAIDAEHGGRVRDGFLRLVDGGLLEPALDRRGRTMFDRGVLHRPTREGAALAAKEEFASAIGLVVSRTGIELMTDAPASGAATHSEALHAPARPLPRLRSTKKDFASPHALAMRVLQVIVDGPARPSAIVQAIDNGRSTRKSLTRQAIYLLDLAGLTKLPEDKVRQNQDRWVELSEHGRALMSDPRAAKARSLKQAVAVMARKDALPQRMQGTWTGGGRAPGLPIEQRMRMAAEVIDREGETTVQHIEACTGRSLDASCSQSHRSVRNLVMRGYAAKVARSRAVTGNAPFLFALTDAGRLWLHGEERPAPEHPVKSAAAETESLDADGWVFPDGVQRLSSGRPGIAATMADLERSGDLMVCRATGAVRSRLTHFSHPEQAARNRMRDDVQTLTSRWATTRELGAIMGRTKQTVSNVFGPAVAEGYVLASKDAPVRFAPFSLLHRGALAIDPVLLRPIGTLSLPARMEEEFERCGLSRVGDLARLDPLDVLNNQGWGQDEAAALARALAAAGAEDASGMPRQLSFACLAKFPGVELAAAPDRSDGSFLRSLLMEWMDKSEIAKRSGLTSNAVSEWIVNALAAGTIVSLKQNAGTKLYALRVGRRQPHPYHGLDGEAAQRAYAATGWVGRALLVADRFAEGTFRRTDILSAFGLEDRHGHSGHALIQKMVQDGVLDVLHPSRYVWCYKVKDANAALRAYLQG